MAGVTAQALGSILEAKPLRQVQKTRILGRQSKSCSHLYSRLSPATSQPDLGITSLVVTHDPPRLLLQACLLTRQEGQGDTQASQVGGALPQAPFQIFPAHKGLLEVPSTCQSLVGNHVRISVLPLLSHSQARTVGSATEVTRRIRGGGLPDHDKQDPVLYRRVQSYRS